MKIKNDIELAASEAYDTLHPSASIQTFNLNTKEGITRKSVDGAYDNPAMIMKD